MVATLFFSQGGDIGHTVNSSYAYLQGHFVDFYDYNQKLVQGNDYLPLIYLIYGLWMAPIYLMGMSSAGHINAGYALAPAELIWAKILIAAAFYYSVLLVRKLAARYFPGETAKQTLVTFAYLSSPFAFFAFAIFNQYDVFGVVFVLLALLAFSERRYSRFAIWISFAISFKFFAVLLVVPLLLLLNISFLKRIHLMGIALSVPALQIAVYWLSPAFQVGVFRLTNVKANDASAGQNLVAIMLYLGLLYWSFNRKATGSFNRDTVFICISAYALLFNIVYWHPQWVLIITPFLALALGFTTRFRRTLFFELLAFLAFIWFVVNAFPGNVDGTLATRGPLSGLYGEPRFDLSAVYLPFFAQLGLASVKIFLLVAAASMLITPQDDASQHTSSVTTRTRLLRVLAPAFLLLIPGILATTLPMPLAKILNPNAELTQFHEVQVVSISPEQKPLGEFVRDSQINQTFLAPAGKVSAMSVLLATYNRVNAGSLRVNLTDSSKKIIFSELVDTAELTDNSYRTFFFDAITLENSDQLTLSMEAEQGDPGRSVTAWVTSSDTYSQGTLYLNNEQQIGDLVFNLYYKKD